MLEKPLRMLPDVSLFYFGNAPSFSLMGSRIVSLIEKTEGIMVLLLKSQLFGLQLGQKQTSKFCGHPVPYEVSSVTPMSPWDSSESLASLAVVLSACALQWKKMAYKRFDEIVEIPICDFWAKKRCCHQSGWVYPWVMSLGIWLDSDHAVKQVPCEPRPGAMRSSKAAW